jgi:hypothetical protein
MPVGAIEATRAIRMKASAVLKTLKQLGNPNTAKIYARHGVVEETFGVPYAALSKLVKKLDPDGEAGRMS